MNFSKVQTLSAKLSWSHICELLSLDNIIKINYYIYITDKQNLSVRELRERIKSKESERIGFKTELEEPKATTLIKNPIMIKVKDKNERLTEYALHRSILENMDDFLKELGIGFAYIGSEVKIKMGDRYNYNELNDIINKISNKIYIVFPNVLIKKIRMSLIEIPNNFMLKADTLSTYFS